MEPKAYDASIKIRNEFLLTTYLKPNFRLVFIAISPFIFIY